MYEDIYNFFLRMEFEKFTSLYFLPTVRRFAYENGKLSENGEKMTVFSAKTCQFCLYFEYAKLRSEKETNAQDYFWDTSHYISRWKHSNLHSDELAGRYDN